MAHEDEGESYGGGADPQNMNLTSIHPIHWTNETSCLHPERRCINPKSHRVAQRGSAIIVEDWMARRQGDHPDLLPWAEVELPWPRCCLETAILGQAPLTVGQNESTTRSSEQRDRSRHHRHYHGYRLFEKRQAGSLLVWLWHELHDLHYSICRCSVLARRSRQPALLNVQVTVRTPQGGGDEVVELTSVIPTQGAQAACQRAQASRGSRRSWREPEASQLSIPATTRPMD